MPATPNVLTINPNGATLTVAITDSYGTSITAYTASGGSTTHSLPKSISASTSFYLTADDTYTVTATYGAVTIFSQAVTVAGGADVRLKVPPHPALGTALALSGYLTAANYSVADDATGFATDTYLTGSSIAIPAGGAYVGLGYELIVQLSKTGAGSAAPTFNIRYGTAGAVGDASICQLAFGTGSAASDSAYVKITGWFRTVGATTTAIFVGNANAITTLAATGFTNATKNVQTTGSGFDSTPASSIIGCSYNGGASAVHTVQMVRARLLL